MKRGEQKINILEGGDAKNKKRIQSVTIGIKGGSYE